MFIQHSEDDPTGTFYIEENGKLLAEMVYAKQPGRMVIQHTQVDETLRGQNVGFELVEHGVEYARKHNLKVVPLCQFAKKLIERHKEFQDVL